MPNTEYKATETEMSKWAISHGWYHISISIENGAGRTLYATPSGKLIWVHFDGNTVTAVFYF